MSVVSQNIAESESDNYVSLRDIDSDTILKSLDKQCDEDMLIFPGFKAIKRPGRKSSVNSTADTSEFSTKDNTKSDTKLTLQSLLSLDKPSSTMLEAFLVEGPKDDESLSGLLFENDDDYSDDVTDGVDDTNENSKSSEICLELPPQIHPLDDPGRFGRRMRCPSLDSTRAFIDGDTASRRYTF